METKDIYEFGPFRADGRRKSLARNGATIPLPAKAFDVLYALLQKPGQTVHKDDLMKEVWSDTFVEEGNLTQMVFLLRKALEETDGGQPLIVTVPRQGYRFAGDLARPAVGLADQPALQPIIRHTWWIAVAISLLSGFGGWSISRSSSRKGPLESQVVRYTISPQQNTSYRVGRVSPDGRSLALLGVDFAGKGHLWVRRLDSLVARPLGDAEFWPFWSPDSRFVAFAQEGKLKRIEASGGTPQTICSAALVIGGSWNRDGTIIFGDGNVISLVRATGGEPRPLTRLDAAREETTHNFPVFLPDGSHFLYTIHSRKRENGGIYVGSLAAPDARIRLLDDISNAEYAPASPDGTGYVLFVRGGALMAQRFAENDSRLRGEAFTVVEKIARNPGNLSASFSASSASEGGVLLVTATYPGDQVTWFDRTGKRLGVIGAPGLVFYPQLSPDGQTVAVDVNDAERFSTDIRLFPVVRGSASRLTFHGAVLPVWSPDGSRIIFESPNAALYVKTSAGTENESLLLEGLNLPDDYRLPCEWSKDGRFLIYSQRDAKTGYDLWMLPLLGNRKPVSILHTEFNELCGTLSPDGRWIAYASDESGRTEIYVQAFTEDRSGSGRKWQVSDNGGYWPKWRRDGKELLFLAPDKEVVGVEVAVGMSFRHGTPQPLFASGIRIPEARFDVTNDGKFFLIPAAVMETNPEPATVIINWGRGIQR